VTSARTHTPITFSRLQPQPSTPGSHHVSDTLPRRPVAAVADSVHTFSRELPQPSAPADPGYTHYQFDTPPRLFPLSRMPAAPAITDHAYTHTPPHLQLRTFPRSLEPACTQSTMTSVLPYQPVYSPPREEVLISALPRPPSLVRPPYREDVVTSAFLRPLTAPSEDVVTSALPHPLTAPVDFAYNAMQRLADSVDNRNNVYTNSLEPWLTEFPPPPHVNTQSVPLLSDNTQTTANLYENTDNIIPSLSAHRYADLPMYVNTTPYSSAPLSQAIAFDQPGFSAFSRVDVHHSRPAVADSTVQYTVGTSVSTTSAPLQSPSVHWRKRLAYDYIQPDTGLGAPTHVAPAIHSGYIRPQTSDTHTHTHTHKIVCNCKPCHLEKVN